MTFDETLNILPDTPISLEDVGAPGYGAATAIDHNGDTHLLIVHLDALGDWQARYDPDCTDAIHEQLGPLPIEYIRRLTIALRAHRRDNPQRGS